MSPIEVVDLSKPPRPPSSSKEIRELVDGAIWLIDWIRSDPKRTAAALGIAAMVGAVLLEVKKK